VLFFLVPIRKITTQKRNICGQEFLPFSAVGVNKIKRANINVGYLAAAVCSVYVNRIFHQKLKLVDEMFMVLSFVLDTVT
jgi:hypothetical protein